MTLWLCWRSLSDLKKSLAHIGSGIQCASGSFVHIGGDDVAMYARWISLTGWIWSSRLAVTRAQFACRLFRLHSADSIN
jgi:hypothetical protein